MQFTLICAGSHAKQCIDVFADNFMMPNKIIDDGFGNNEKFYDKFVVEPFTSKIDDWAFCASGSPEKRAMIVANFPTTQWINCISKKAHISPSAKIGVGVYIGPFAVVGPHAVIGNFSIINDGSRVMHDSRIGNFCNISPGATLCGKVEIADFCFIGANATLNPNTKITSKATIIGLVQLCLTMWKEVVHGQEFLCEKFFLDPYQEPNENKNKTKNAFPSLCHAEIKKLGTDA
jgi:sugar O-acyltransferase (sialic acid O-acetyltransferase NeuD family)